MGNNETIFGAADRLLTHGTTQSEPTLAKIYHFDGPPPVTVMWAGSAAVFGEVIQNGLDAAKKSKPKSIQDIVDLYCNAFANYVGKRAERAILARLGITRQT